MKAEYSFLKVNAGRCAFARVEVEAAPGGETVKVVNGLPRSTDHNQGEVARGQAPKWQKAALDGIRRVLRRARQDGALGTGCRATLVRLVGTVADTNTGAVRCAAGLAAWRALHLAGPGPEPVFEGRAWSLRFPAAQPSPAEGVSR
jgi:hypothetical protein